MSLYNNLFGVDSEAGYLLHILNLTENDIPRFRTCYYDNKKNLIVIHTRTGGGNREYYDSFESCQSNYPEYFEGDEPPSGPWNSDLQSHPLYITDYDDNFDCTYANFVFKVPEEHEAKLKEAFEGKETITPSEKWQLLFQSMDQKIAENKGKV